MKLTPKQQEALEKIASILPDILSSIKLTMTDPEFNTKENVELLDDHMGKLLDLTHDYFQFKDRSDQVIDPSLDPILEDPTFSPIIDMAHDMIKNQTRQSVFNSLLPILVTRKDFDEGKMIEALEVCNLYTNTILKNYFQEDK